MKVHSCLHGRAPAYLCSKFSRKLNTEYRETRGANNIQLYNACPHIWTSTESLLSSMGLTCGTNFPGISSQSKPENHLSRLFGSICLNLNNYCLFLFFVTHPVLSYAFFLVFDVDNDSSSDVYIFKQSLLRHGFVQIGYSFLILLWKSIDVSAGNWRVTDS